MSTYYGNLQGNRGEATRQGSRTSGIWAAVRSWNGSVRIDMDTDAARPDDPAVTVTVSKGSSAAYGRRVLACYVSDLLTAEELEIVTRPPRE